PCCCVFTPFVIAQRSMNGGLIVGTRSGSQVETQSERRAIERINTGAIHRQTSVRILVPRTISFLPPVACMAELSNLMLLPELSAICRLAVRCPAPSFLIGYTRKREGLRCSQRSAFLGPTRCKLETSPEPGLRHSFALVRLFPRNCVPAHEPP